MIPGIMGNSLQPGWQRHRLSDSRKGSRQLWLQPLDGSAGRQLTNFTALKIYWYQWSFDGKSLALVRGDSPSDLVLIQDSQKK